MAGPAACPSPESVLPAAQLARAERFAGPARWLGWARSRSRCWSPACWASPRRASVWSAGSSTGSADGGGSASSWGRPSCCWRAGSPPCRSRRSPTTADVVYGLSTQGWLEWGRGRRRVVDGQPRRHQPGRARRGGHGPALARLVAGDRRRHGGGPGDARVVRLPARSSSRSSTPSRRCRTARCDAGVLRLADEEGVHVDDVLVADASRRTTTLNAYVSGLRRHPPRGALRQPGARRAAGPGRSRWWRTSSPTRGTTTCSRVAAGRRRSGAGDGPARPAAAGATEGGEEPGNAEPPGIRRWCHGCWPWWRWRACWPSPVQNGISRRIETRADVDAPAWPRSDPEAFIAVQRQLAARSLADLTSPAWSQFWFGSHPTTRERIAIAGWLSDRAGSDLGAAARCSGDGVAGVLEQVAEDALAEEEDGGDDDGGDAGDQQAVLDGRGAALVATWPSPSAARTRNTAAEGAERSMVGSL